MAVIKKNELEAMRDAQRTAKIAELKKAILELHGEGRVDKARPLRKAIAKLYTPKAEKPKINKDKK
jgi:ribosomal protein L29